MVYVAECLRVIGAALGAEVPPLGTDWLEDVVQIAVAESEELGAEIDRVRRESRTHEDW